MRAICATAIVLVLAACAGTKDMSKKTDEAPAAGAEPASEPGTKDMSTGTGPEVAPVEAGSTPTGESVPAAGPPIAEARAPQEVPARLLGRRRAEVEAALGELRPAADGWMVGGAIEVRLRGGRCVGLRGQVPSDMDCADVATWLGYGPGAYPLRRAERCEWPGISLKHRLAEGVAGSYVPATRRFEVWLRQ